MLDSGLLISWGEIDPGRVEHALLRLLSEVVAYYDKLLEEGRISGFEPFVLGGRGRRGLRGFMIVRGTPEQITIVAHDDELLGYLSRARRLMHDVGVQELYLGDTLRHTMVAFEHPQGRRGRVALGDALPPSGALEPPLQLRSRTQPRTVRRHQIDLRDVSRDPRRQKSPAGATGGKVCVDRESKFEGWDPQTRISRGSSAAREGLPALAKRKK